MKKKIIIPIVSVVTVAIIAAIVSIVLVSCNKESNDEIKEPMTEIGTTGLEYVSGTYKVTVDTDVDNYDIASKIMVSEGATIVFSKSEDFATIANGKSIDLNPGENIVFAKVVDVNGFEKIHRINVYKKQIFTINFDTDGGTKLEPITVKEGSIVDDPPQTLKSGYTFVKWSYDFSQPANSSQTAKAIWKANEYEISIYDGNYKTTKKATFGENYSLEDCVINKAGYNFTGWMLVFEENDSTIKVPFAETGVYNYDYNIKVEAVFKPIDYAINYVCGVGISNPNTATKFTIESHIELLDAIWADEKTRDEMEFDGWYTSESFDPSTKITSISNLTESITLWAKFHDVSDRFKSNVVCNVDDEYVNEPFSFESVFTYKTTYSLPTPTPKTMYIFDGWYDENGQKVDLEGIWLYKYNENVSLVAKFVGRENDVEYMLPDGATNNEKNLSDYNSQEDGDVTLYAPSFGEHRFDGWYLDPEFKNKIEKLTGDVVNESNEITLYSKWTYFSKVDFLIDGEVFSDFTQKYEYDKEYELPKPTKDGNYFTGWSYNNEQFPQSGTWKYKENITLVANWVPSNYAINYVLNGEADNSENPTSFELFAPSIELKVPTMGNAIFEGWYTDSNFENPITEIDTSIFGEITLYAKWKTVTINYNSNGGAIPSASQTIVYGTQYKLLVPEMLGFEFKGWYIDDTKIPSSGEWTFNFESGTTLLAKWTMVEYTISYDLGAFGSAQGAENLPEEYNVRSNEIQLPILYKEGYLFLGWQSNGITSRNIVIPKGSTGNRTYKAIWESSKDTRGFVYEFEGDHLICIGFEREVDATQVLYMPSEYFGYTITTIKSNAFSSFGEAFGKSDYKNASYYYTICIPQTITLIETDAFNGCNGICISLYREDNSLIDSTKTDDLAVLLDWEKNMTYASCKSNKQVRDCIWGFRPAIGWSRYSAVVIPDYYE